ncbi:Protein STRUBBELIG-RECEPTOR FAMILY 5 [Bienertia sinuspersici]
MWVNSGIVTKKREKGVKVSGGGMSENTAEEVTAKAVQKRYEGLIMVRNKAVRGKGAWYWAHLEPLLVHNADTGLPKAVKLKCCLCDTMFSASNPSRTASEHLKRGTCPNFSSPRPVSSVSPPPQVEAPHSGGGGGGGGGGVAAANNIVNTTSGSGGGTTTPPPPPPQYNHRKRSSSSSSGGGSGAGVGSGSGGTTPNMNASTNTNTATATAAPYVAPLSVIDPSRFTPEMGFGGGGALVVHPMQQQQPQQQQQQHQQQSMQQQLAMMGGGGGGRGDDMSNARGMFEDSIKRLKSPKASPGCALSKSQVECAIDYLSDWVYESCGSVSFSSLEHPKFKAFLNQVGVPEVSKKEVCGSRLDARYEEVRNESEVKIRDAMFFQIACEGWKPKGGYGYEENLVNITVNLPNGTSVYRRAVFTGGQVPCKYAEEVLWETMAELSGNGMHKCVGIVGDKFKKTALRNLESDNPWLVNLSCQYQALNSLIKDMYREVGLFRNVGENCLKLANFINNKTQVRIVFHKYQMREYGVGGLFRVPLQEKEEYDDKKIEGMNGLIEDIIRSGRVMQLVLLDESFKIASMEDPLVRDFGEMIRNGCFWNELDAVRSLVRMVKVMAEEMESERALVGQCLEVWEELRRKVKDWCGKFQISEEEGGLIEKLIEKRFRKNYHPAWAAAYILDPVYLMRDSSGKYLPPFKYLTNEQEKDVDKLITRLVSREEAHIALMELMKWRTQGLDPVYAQAVQLKQRDPVTGKMRIANPHGSRLVWETYLPEFKSLAKVALRLIFLHATARGFKCNSSFLKWIQPHTRSRSAIDRAQKIIFIAAHSKLDRRDFTTDEQKDQDLFASATGDDDDDTVGLGQPP